jgi:hypothetical protein
MTGSATIGGAIGIGADSRRSAATHITAAKEPALASRVDVRPEFVGLFDDIQNGLCASAAGGSLKAEGFGDGPANERERVWYACLTIPKARGLEVGVPTHHFVFGGPLPPNRHKT